MKRILEIMKKLYDNIPNSDVFTQIRAVTIFINILLCIVGYFGGFQESCNIKTIGLDERSTLILIVALILSPFAILISFKKKEYFGIIAALSTLCLISAMIFEIDMMYSLWGLLILFSIGYLIIKRDMNRSTLIGVSILTGIVLLGVFFWIIFLFQLALVTFIFYALYYTIYHAIKDNIGLLVSIGKAKCYYLFTKAFFLWCPLLIVIVPGFYLSGLIDQAAIRIDNALLGTDVPAGCFKPEELECGLNLICYINPVNVIKKQMNYHYKKLNISKNISEIKLLVSDIFRTVLQIISLISNFILWFLIIRSFLYVFARIAVSVKHNIPYLPVK